MTGTAEQARQAAAANGKTVLGAGAAGGQTVQRGAHRAAQAVGRYRVPAAAATATVAVAAALAAWLVVQRRRADPPIQPLPSQQPPAGCRPGPVSGAGSQPSSHRRAHYQAQRRKCGRERCAQTALAFFFSRSARSVSRSYSRP